ncbi:hypothetical protein BJ742DRAFT_737355 [Cladochytrium replicatum]|nr:hypothetical protein BJ742DRAFT_737355 [Cladochytrium replicatum]
MSMILDVEITKPTCYFCSYGSPMISENHRRCKTTLENLRQKEEQDDDVDARTLLAEPLDPREALIEKNRESETNLKLVFAVTFIVGNFGDPVLMREWDITIDYLLSDKIDVAHCSSWFRNCGGRESQMTLKIGFKTYCQLLSPEQPKANIIAGYVKKIMTERITPAIIPEEIHQTVLKLNAINKH